MSRFPFFNIKKSIVFYLLFLHLLLFNKLKAQILVLGDSSQSASLNFQECGKADTLTAFIRVASGSLGSTTLFVDSLPNNFAFAGIISNTTINSYTNIGNHVVKIYLNATAVNNAGTAGVFFQYLVRAKCGANSLSSAPRTLKIYSGSFLFSRPAQDLVSSINAATLILEARNNVNNTTGVVGNNYTRNWRIRNTSTFGLIDTLYFRVIYQAGIGFHSALVDGNSILPTRISGDTVWFKINKLLRNQTSFAGDTIFIQETYSINSCPATSSSSEVSAYWGCYNSPICNIDTRFPATQVPITVPNVKTQFDNIKYGCYGSYDTITIRVINTGSGTATQLRVRVDLCYPIEAYYSNVLLNDDAGFLDTGSMQIKLGKNGIFQKISPDSTVSYSALRSFIPVNYPPGIAYLQGGNLKGGDTLYLTFRRFRGQYSNSHCGSARLILNTRLHYKNNCQTISFYSPMSNLLGEWHGFYGKTNFNGPAYLRTGDSAVFAFRTIAGSNNSFFKGTSHYFKVKITLPTGILWNQDQSRLILRRIGSIINPDSIYYSAANKVLEAYYKNTGGGMNSYEINPKFVLDCSIAGAGSDKAISIQWSYIISRQGCLWQEIPYSCKDEYQLDIKCPNPCPRGGVIPYFSEFRRITYGLPDNDNNGVPDVSGSLDMNKIEWNKLAPRDTFSLTYKGYILKGSQSPSIFGYAYGRVWIPTYGNYITPVDAKVTIKDYSTGNSFTLNNLSVTQRDTSGRRTFLYNWSANLSGVPSGYNFDSYDSFVFVARYVFNKDVVESGVVDNVVYTNQDFYVSNVANPILDSAKYRCDQLPGLYRVVLVYKGYNGGFRANFNGCNSTVVYSDYFQSFGDCCNNYAGSLHFPFEYRLFTTLDTIRIKIPNGYIVDSTRLFYYYTAGAGKVAGKTFNTVLPISISGEWYTFLLTPFYTFAGGNTVPSTTGSYWIMHNYVKPSCSVPSGSSLIQYTADRWIGRNSWQGISTRGVANNHNRGTFDFSNSALLDLTNVAATSVSGITKTVTWDFKLQNNSAVATANNSWIAIASKSGQIIVDSVRNLATNLNLTKVNDIFRVGNIANSGAAVNMRIFARYTNCNKDSLMIYAGWNCNSYPTQLSSTGFSCRVDSIKTFVQPINPLVQTNIMQEPTFPANLCDTLNYTLSISNRQIGSAYYPYLEVEIPNGGVGMFPAGIQSYRYPYNSGSYKKATLINLGGGKYRMYLGDSILDIAKNGLKPLAEAPFNEIYVKLKFMTNCDFISGSIIKFSSTSQKICGTYMEPDADYSTITMVGAPSPKLHFSFSRVPEITRCNQNFTIAVSTVNLELNPTNSGDKIIILLPQGTRYVSGSINFTRNGLTPNNPRIDTVSGRQRLQWEANSIPSLDSTVFTLQYRSDANTQCYPNNIVTLQTISEYGTTCGAILCQSFYENSKTEFNRPVYKPNLLHLTGTGTARIIQDTSIGNRWVADTLHLSNIQFSNVGNDTADLPIARIFLDSNNNGAWDYPEKIFYTDTFPMVTPGTTYVYSKTKIAPHLSLPANGTIAMSVRQYCNCDSNVFSAKINSMYIPLFAENFELSQPTIKNCKVQLNWKIYDQKNISEYLISRKILGQNNFEIIAKITAQGNSFGIQNYSVETPVPSAYKPEIYTYQIIGISVQGKVYSNSEDLSINNQKCNPAIQVFPNPNKGEFQICTPHAKGFSYKLYSVQGVEIQQGISPLACASVSIPNLKSGSYFIKIQFGNQIHIEKLGVN